LNLPALIYRSSVSVCWTEEAFLAIIMFKKQKLGYANNLLRILCNRTTLPGKQYVNTDEIGKVGNKPFLFIISKFVILSNFTYSLIGLSPLCRSIFEVRIRFPVNKNEILDAKCARFGIAINKCPSSLNTLRISISSLFYLFIRNFRCSMTSKHRTKSYLSDLKGIFVISPRIIKSDEKNLSNPIISIPSL